MTDAPDLDKYYQPQNAKRRKKQEGFVRKIAKNSERILEKTSNRMLLIKQALSVMLVAFGVPILAMMFYSSLSKITDKGDSLTHFLEISVLVAATIFGIYWGFAGLLGILSTAGKMNRGEIATFEDVFAFTKKKYLLKIFLALLFFGAILGFLTEIYHYVFDGCEVLAGLAARYYGESAFYGVTVCLIPLGLFFLALGALILSLAVMLLPVIAENADLGAVKTFSRYFAVISNKNNFRKVLFFGVLTLFMALVSVLPIGILFLLFFIPRFALDSTNFISNFTEG